jgi:FkbM family methyltransferase
VSTVKSLRNGLMGAATFWKTRARRNGINLSLRKASPAVRYALMVDYEIDDVRLCNRFLDAQDRVLEIGSAIGFISLYCLKRIGVARIAMVEANPDLLDVIDENFRMNETPTQPVFNVAVGPVDGIASFSVSSDYFSSSMRSPKGTMKSITVPQLTIPSLIAQLDFTPNTLIIDIEGSEIDLPIEHYALFDKILIELHARFVGKAPIDALTTKLADAGFVMAGTEGYSAAFIRQSQPASAARVSLEEAVG